VAAPGDERLIQFEMWYEQEVARLFNYISYRVRNRAAAEDLLGTICEKAVTNLHRYDPVQGSIRWWIYGIARHELLHYWRDASRKPGTVSLDSLPELRTRDASVEDSAERLAAARSLIHQLSELPEREQELIALRYGADLPTQDIARIMGLTDGNVRVMLHRTLDKLRNLLVVHNGAENA
jgi:RNA polymerase sigma factor (sigma-70 family)